LGLGLSETCGDPKTCVQVAKGGNLEVLMKWLQENAPSWPPWEEEIIVKADIGGNLEGLKWAREQDPP